MPVTFCTTRRIEFVDTDMAGIVHFSNFFRFMESAEVEFLRSRGLSVKLDFEGQKLGFPRVSASCDYFKPVYFQDVVTVIVTLERVGEKSVTYAFEFQKDGAVMARGRVSAVCCRIEPNQSIESVAIPAGLRQKLEAEDRS